ncbi:MAG: hypothetical protein ACYC0H_19035 [Solirubrobacteraceae bacterium]
MTKLAASPSMWLRSRGYTFGWGSLMFALGACWVGFIVYFLTTEHWKVAPTIATKIGFSVFGAMWASACVLVGIRLMRAGLWIGEQEVVVRGPLRTRRLPRDQVTGFVVGGALSPCPVLHQVHGRSVPVTALSSTGLLRSSESKHAQTLAPLCDQLNETLAGLRGKPTAATEIPLSRTRAANRARARAVLLGLMVFFWVAAAAVIVLAPNPALAGVIGVMVVCDTCWTALALRQIRKNALPGGPSA